MTRWPKDNQSDLIRFYGDPGSKSFYSDNVTKVFPPFKMYYDGKPMPYLAFHKKAAPALKRALDSIWEYVGEDQSVLDKEGISDCAGTYNPRKVRGSVSKWSNHAYASAIDLDAKANGLNAKGDMPLWVIAAFKREGFRWGGDYKGRKDPMHFEAVWNGEDDIAFAADDTMTVADATAILNQGHPGFVNPVAFADVPLGDAHDEPDHQESWLKRKWKAITGWSSGGAGLGFLGYLTDWRVIVSIFGAVILVSVLFVVFMGPDDVRAWIKKQVT